MPIFLTAACENALGSSSACNNRIPVRFESHSETWGDVLEFLASAGWKIEGGPEQESIRVICPECAKPNLAQERG